MPATQHATPVVTYDADIQARIDALGHSMQEERDAQRKKAAELAALRDRVTATGIEPDAVAKLLADHAEAERKRAAAATADLERQAAEVETAKAEALRAPLRAKVAAYEAEVLFVEADRIFDALVTIADAVARLDASRGEHQKNREALYRAGGFDDANADPTVPRNLGRAIGAQVRAFDASFPGVMNRVFTDARQLSVLMDASAYARWTREGRAKAH